MAFVCHSVPFVMPGMRLWARSGKTFSKGPPRSRFNEKLFSECSHNAVAQFFQTVFRHLKFQLKRRRRNLVFQFMHAIGQFLNLRLLLEEYSVVMLLQFTQRVIHAICEFINMLIMIGICTHAGAQLLCSA